MKNNYLISLSLIALTSLSAHADTLSTQLLQCAKYKENTERLACFDNLAANEVLPNYDVKVSEVAPKVAKARSKAPDKANTKADNFGAEHLKKTAPKAEDLEIVFTVAKLSKDHYGKWRFTFKNGQKWKQADAGHMKLKVGDEVLLKKGFLNSVHLKLNKPDSNKSIRVKRLK